MKKKHIFITTIILLLAISIFSIIQAPKKKTNFTKVSSSNNSEIKIAQKDQQGSVLAQATGTSTFTLSGTIFIDTNGNGIKDNNEIGKQNVTVALSGNTSASTTTDANGNYTFPSLTNGNYTITITVPSGYQATTSSSQTINLLSNQTVNFGIIPTYNLSGNVYLDANRNQTKDTGETNFQGAIISIKGPVNISATTDANGNYNLTNLRSGTYTVTITAPSNYLSTTASSLSITLNSDQSTNFGIAQAYNVSGLVFIDTNKNGVYDAGESGYQGATITLSGASSATLQSGGGGNFTTAYLFPGTYTLTLTVPNNYQNTTVTTQTITLSTSNQTVNFGLTPYYTISGTAYNDNNRNGTQDKGEQIYPGITVTLSGDKSATTTTDTNGNYTFTNLVSGTYTVTFTVPTKHKSTTTVTQTFNLTANQTANFGVVAIYNITGKAFIDNNSNGIIDPGESYYQNGTITLSGDTSATANTDASGNYAFNNIYAGNYTIAFTVPQGYRATTADSINFSLNADQTFNFGITPSNITKVGGKCNSNTTDIMMVIDHSSSMADSDPATGNQKLQEAKTAASQFVDIIAQKVPSARIGIVQLAGSQNYPNDPSTTGVLLNLTNDFNQVKNAINSISLSYGTCFECAIKTSNDALNSQGRPQAQKMTIFMTDGLADMDIASQGNLTDTNTAENEAMTQVVNGVNSQNIIYNTIGIGNGSGNIDEPFLQKIAQTNGGVYYNDPNNGDLESIFNTIAANDVGSATINGLVFNDTNNNGQEDAGEQPLSNWTIQVTGGTLTNPVTTTTKSDGTYTLTGLCSNTYTVSQVLQSGWFPTTETSYKLDILNGNTYNNINFGDRNGYTISGTVFNDTNKNYLKDNGELGYTGGININASSGTITTNANGTYSISGLMPGTYTVSDTTAFPSDYVNLYPKNGPPPSFLVTVGNSCTINDATTGATCDGLGNMTNVNFAVSNSTAWIQSYSLDLRADNGFISKIPNTTACGQYVSLNPSQSGTAGVIYSGDNTPNFGQGQASANNWVIGGPVYPETFKSTAPLRTSYTSLLNIANRAGIPLTDITTLNGCSLTSCTLPSNLANGIYQANGDLTLNAYTFPANKNYILLINGNLRILGSINVPTGSTAIFSAAGNINIDKNIKATTNTCPAPSGQLQGIYSADKNFTVEGINNCSIGQDNMLNIEGNIIVNASHTGGSFINNRDLCNDNTKYPSITLKARPDFLFNAPSLLSQQNIYSSEEAN